MEEEELVGEVGRNDAGEQMIGAGHGRRRAEGERASALRLCQIDYALPSLKF